MSASAAKLIAERLADERSRKVAFVSHCLLNENTRYQGGAFRPGSVAEIVAELQRLGVGIYQMRCPEQRAWGGVLRRQMIRAYGSRGTVEYRLRRPALALFVWYTRAVYRRLARDVVTDVEDYVRSGFDVIGIVGVGASPSCGVHTTLDLRRSLEAAAALPLESIDRATFNRDVVVACRVSGQGLYVRELRRQLDRKGLNVPFLEHDLVAEMRGESQTLALTPDAGPR
jgi:predicted secreted protein